MQCEVAEINQAAHERCDVHLVVFHDQFNSLSVYKPGYFSILLTKHMMEASSLTLSVPLDILPLIMTGQTCLLIQTSCDRCRCRSLAVVISAYISQLRSCMVYGRKVCDEQVSGTIRWICLLW